MFAIQNAARKTPQLAKLASNQCRTIVSTPPRCRISFTEKLVHAGILYAGIMVIPMYISCKVRVYNGLAAK